MNAAVYIDGLNLYYGVAKPLDCKWVNLQDFFEKHFPADDIQRIYFFEAMVAGASRANQKAYVDALRTLPKLEIVLGEMKAKTKHCKVRSCSHSGARTWQDYEEKHTDVSIAITMVNDAHKKGYEKLILVTADTDLTPAVKMVRSIDPSLRVSLCLPALDRGRIWGAEPIARESHQARRIDTELFLKCQFPAVIPTSTGNIALPSTWRIAPTTAASDWRARNSGRWLSTLPAWCR